MEMVVREITMCGIAKARNTEEDIDLDTERRERERVRDRKMYTQWKSEIQKLGRELTMKDKDKDKDKKR